MYRVVGGCLGVRVLVFYTSSGTVKRLFKALPKKFFFGAQYNGEKYIASTGAYLE